MTNTLLKTMNLPAYVRIAHDILDVIECNIYEKNTLLPSERGLAVKYKVSKIVINRTLSLLAKQGSIEKIPQKGSFVRAGNRKKAVSRPKILISGSHAPKDINKRQKAFSALLRKEFPEVDIEYIQEEFLPKDRQTFPESADIIICSERLFAKFALEGRLESLVDLNVSIDRSEYFPQPFQQCEINGLPFAVPLNFNPSILYCNQRILEKIGFTGDLNILNWKSFIKICNEIKAKLPEVFPMGYFDFLSCWWENFLYTHGLDIIKADKFETDIFSPNGASAIELMKNLVKNDLADNLTVRRNALELINNDHVTFFICNPRLMGELKDLSSWTIAPVPMGSHRISAANSFLMAINSKSKNISLCKEILSFMLSEKFQLWLGSEYAIGPVHKQALKETYNTPNLKALCAASEVAKMLPNRVEYWNINDELGRAIYQIINGMVELPKIEQEIKNKLYLERKEWNSIRLLGIV
ncbi:MAG: extracellular solute-binding protein [Verrucomicrobiota bacterium]|nr:extracellular solute-binding protein [Verrucomicrobiota bacterium]